MKAIFIIFTTTSVVLAHFLHFASADKFHMILLLIGAVVLTIIAGFALVTMLQKEKRSTAVVLIWMTIPLLLALLTTTGIGSLASVEALNWRVLIIFTGFYSFCATVGGFLLGTLTSFLFRERPRLAGLNVHREVNAGIRKVNKLNLLAFGVLLSLLVAAALVLYLIQLQILIMDSTMWQQVIVWTVFITQLIYFAFKSRQHSIFGDNAHLYQSVNQE